MGPHLWLRYCTLLGGMFSAELQAGGILPEVRVGPMSRPKTSPLTEGTTGERWPRVVPAGPYNNNRAMNG